MNCSKVKLRFYYLGYLLAGLLAVLPSALIASSAKHQIDLRKTLGGDYACMIGQRSVQFLSEHELLLLTGPSENCFRSVVQLQLVVLSLDGHVLARKPWPSTYAGIVISPNRFVLPAPNELWVLNEHLEKIESVPIPAHKKYFISHLDSYFAGDVSLTMDGKTYVFGGAPLAQMDTRKFDDLTSQSNDRLVYFLGDGSKLIKRGNFLVEARDGSSPATLINLNWVFPCDRFCQEYEAGAAFQVVTVGTPRILVISNGSRFPVTDAAGLFPYFRVEVFDLKTGTEVYREEKITKTGKRTAALSPDGDLLATCDEETIVIRKLP